MMALIPALDRKLIRDLLKMKSQGLAISLVMACGVAMFITSLCTLISLSRARDVYYERARFADVFAQVRRAPRSLEDRIAQLPGVARVQTRVVADVTLDVPGLPEPASARLISVPDFHPPALNLVHLRRGRLPEPRRAGEVVASEAFVEAHGFDIGAKISAIINERYQELTIVGVGLSPEYIYQIRPGELLPDDRRFGIFWMNYTALAEAFDMEGAFNDVAISLLPGAGGQEVIDGLDVLLERYGTGGAYGREDQTSHRYISDELQQLRAMATLAPSIFLGVAAFLVSMVLSRIVRTQREQIAALKAFGYSNRRIALHFLGFVVVLSVIGSVLGVALGWQLGQLMTRMYTAFFRFPVFYFVLDSRVVVGAVLLSMSLGTLGALRSVGRAAALPPAEAMRPEPPPEYRPTIIERAGLQRYFGGPTRMILRKLESHPLRALLTCFGISLGIAILILGSFSLDAVNEILDFQFRRAQRYDLAVTFVEPTSPGAAFDVSKLPGVLQSETFRSVPVRLRAGPRERRLAITGLQPDPTLQRLLDAGGRPVPIPRRGLLLSENLATLLGVRPGDTVTVEVLEQKRPVREVVVADTFTGYIGVAAYMDRRALNTLMREDAVISGAFLQTDSAALPRLFATLKETPRIAGVTVKTAAIEAFERTVAESILAMRAIQVAFASIIAFGVVYNAARITLAERARELASMRVLGFTRAEVSFILLGELAILVAGAVPLGLALGTALSYWAVASLQTESYTIPLVILPSTYAFAVTVTLVASVISGLLVRRNVDRLDMIGVLKNA